MKHVIALELDSESMSEDESQSWFEIVFLRLVAMVQSMLFTMGLRKDLVVVSKYEPTPAELLGLPADVTPNMLVRMCERCGLPFIANAPATAVHLCQCAADILVEAHFRRPRTLTQPHKAHQCTWCGSTNHNASTCDAVLELRRLMTRHTSVRALFYQHRHLFDSGRTIRKLSSPDLFQLVMYCWNVPSLRSDVLWMLEESALNHGMAHYINRKDMCVQTKFSELLELYGYDVPDVPPHTPLF
jgi:hypothetical protein